jgi:hypothetical protein
MHGRRMEGGINSLLWNESRWRFPVAWLLQVLELPHETLELSSLFQSDVGTFKKR